MSILNYVVEKPPPLKGSRYFKDFDLLAIS